MFKLETLKKIVLYKISPQDWKKSKTRSLIPFSLTPPSSSTSSHPAPVEPAANIEKQFKLSQTLNPAKKVCLSAFICLFDFRCFIINLNKIFFLNLVEFY